MTISRFTVHGTPAQKGSFTPIRFTRNHPLPGQQKHGIHQHDADPNLPAWTKAVAWAARMAYRGELIETPVIVKFSVFWPYFTSGNPCMEINFDDMIRLGLYPTEKHDIDKTARAILDAMTKIIYEDDGQVLATLPAIGNSCKYWACEGYLPGATIEVQTIK